ncbi:hypothetical protein DFH07DRAFT_776362 [Mycena maculata]|uniref:Uncharacterized protein n=1 Tax=Mycena maculata TaxID=230809 RepID=A0AAD7IMA9_9AGAR|nr:hypothetical protein DFH07DRAFT_776362 [Mycena maculata]
MSSVEDFAAWMDRLTEMPELDMQIVREVIISRSFCRLRQTLKQNLFQNLPRMLSVRRVIFLSVFDANFNVTATPCILSMFPNMTELHLSAVFHDLKDMSKLFSSYGKIKNLSLASYFNDPYAFISSLLNHCPPVGLRSLEITLVQKVLTNTVHSLEQLAVNPKFPEAHLEILHRLKFPVLTLFTAWLYSGQDSELIDTLTTAHKLAVITFWSVFQKEGNNEEYSLGLIMRETLQWGRLTQRLAHISSVRKAEANSIFPGLRLLKIYPPITYRILAGDWRELIMSINA